MQLFQDLPSGMLSYKPSFGLFLLSFRPVQRGTNQGTVLGMEGRF